MHLIFLGTASCYPTKHRGVSCTAVKFNDGDIWLFDCGEGSQLQIHKSSLSCGKVKKIFITHLHGDHLFGLPGFICTMSSLERADVFVLELYGPLGLRQYVHELIPLDWQYPEDLKNWKINEEGDGVLLHPQEIAGRQIISSENVWTLFQDSHAIVKAGALVHRIPCFGFSIQQNPTVGSLKAGLLMKMGLKPGPLYGKLKQGEPVILESGQTINPEDVLEPSKPGLKVVILGDTCDSSGMADIALDCDYIVHEATLEDAMMEKAIVNGHSTPSMAAAFAEQIKAKNLVLFHFSQRYKAKRDKEPSLKILYNETVEAFELLGHDCKVTIAEDFMELTLIQNKKRKSS
ncbi:zinc phosphodiesterase ELAC protein 1 isoform X2 [Halyomorpha halys]|uniref:zinc phosphodiesterase ELAC protein 1 isoform X2 n=1 Tax=Halyomorpha halys TaxID=286706 RepID=UPI0006D50C81|nr:zinc phosphodiesterase ELAC protein 1-like isoform X2 [Halyomorpha halys]